METQPVNGQITIAPEVLETIARLTTLAVPGVARLAPPPGIRHMLRHDGVGIEVVNRRVLVTLHVITESNVQMLDLGRKIQSEVTRAIRDMVGMEVASVEVHIEDVAYTSDKT
ncbi:MAG: Asp23/Gls24 family envelope stress response protein [Anaerolineae bacterium]|nr:Asp23/Gls24 family envelope stress response protein [Anaerolineae bacterium]